jgi:hypothetical protein
MRGFFVIVPERIFSVLKSNCLPVRERKETKFLREPVQCPKLHKIGNVVQRIIVAPSPNYCCSGNRTMCSVCT